MKLVKNYDELMKTVASGVDIRPIHETEVLLPHAPTHMNTRQKHEHTPTQTSFHTSAPADEQTHTGGGTQVLRGHDMHVKQCLLHMRSQSRRAIGLTLARTQIKRHLQNYGIEEDLATSKLKGFSGGQKSRVVLAGPPHGAGAVCRC